MAEHETQFIVVAEAALANLRDRPTKLADLIYRLKGSEPNGLVTWNTGLFLIDDVPLGEYAVYDPLIIEIQDFLSPLIIGFDYAEWEPFQDGRIREHSFVQHSSPVDLVKFFTSWNRIEYWNEAGWSELISGDRPWLLETALQRLSDIVETLPET